MNIWFLDASVLLAAEDGDDDNHEAARLLLVGDVTLATLDLAFYEVSNVALRVWRDPAAAARLQGVVESLDEDGGLYRVEGPLAAEATSIADRHDLSVYDAAYVAGAAAAAARLVSCDMRDLVSNGLAVAPRDAT